MAIDPLLGPITDDVDTAIKLNRSVASSAQILVSAFRTKGIAGEIRLVQDVTRPPNVCTCAGNQITVLIRYKKGQKPLPVKGRVYMGGELLAQYLLCAGCGSLSAIKINKGVFPDLILGMPTPQDPL